MNTGIQDAYNLAWKLALVLKGAAPETLLDSYEAERRPVGVEAVACTRAASENYGREQGAAPDRLADRQIRVSYRGSSWVFGDTADFVPTAPAAGDRAPDAGGLRRRNAGFPLRLFDVLRGTEHVLITHLPAVPSPDRTAELADFIRQAGSGLTDYLRTVVIAGPKPRRRSRRGSPFTATPTIRDGLWRARGLFS